VMTERFVNSTIVSMWIFCGNEILRDALNSPSHWHVIAYGGWILGSILSRQKETMENMRETSRNMVGTTQIYLPLLISCHWICATESMIYLSFGQENSIRLALMCSISISNAGELENSQKYSGFSSRSR
jgi:hypothetical protein